MQQEKRILWKWSNSRVEKCSGTLTLVMGWQYYNMCRSSTAPQLHSSTAPHVQEQEQCIWRNASHRVARKQLGARLIHFASFHALLDCERLNDDVDVNFISNTTKGQHQQSYEETSQKNCETAPILGIPDNLAEIVKFCQNCKILSKL